MKAMIKFVVAVALVSLCASAYCATTTTVNGIAWTYTVSNGKVSLGDDASYTRAVPTSTIGALTIPSSLGGYPVTRIGKFAFNSCTNLTSVTIPNSVMSIGYQAFGSCTKLTSVTIPNSVTNIGGYAFSACLNLTSVMIPNGVTYIENNTFSGCRGLTSVTIPNSVTSIGDHAFSDCSGLTSVHITDLTKWCNISFDGYYANPLYYAHNLYLNGVRVTELTIPNSVKNIGSYAFSGCSGLTSVAIPDSVTSIGGSAFSGCSGLDEITLPFIGARRGNSGSSDSLFGYIFGTSYYTGGARAYQYYSSDFYSSYYIPSQLRKVVVTDETVLGYGAFYGCTNLTSVTIPNSVTSIRSCAFFRCSASLFDTNTITGVMLVDGWAVGYTYPLFSGQLNLTGIRGIGDDAFSGCSGLTSVTIPDSVTSIGPSAFSGCSGLTSVAIPDSVTSIGSSAFYGCTNLTSVAIPDSVTSIGSSAFYGCTNLTSVAIPDSVTRIGDYAFSGCSGLTSVVIPSRWSLSWVFASSYGKIESVTIPSGSTIVVARAYEGCRSLKSVTIPNTVTSIGNNAFYNCSSLQSLSIPDTVTSIGGEAFYNCSSLQSLSVPGSVTSYGANCFEGCPAYTLSLYRAIFGGSSGGGSPVVVTSIVQNIEAPYALTGTAADRAIASVRVNSDCAIDSFVLKDGKVYDSMLYVSNTADREVTLSLPSGYTYKTIKGARPLTIPASSQCIISITRVAANVFLVMREELDDVQ